MNEEKKIVLFKKERKRVEKIIKKIGVLKTIILNTNSKSSKYFKNNL